MIRLIAAHRETILCVLAVPLLALFWTAFLITVIRLKRKRWPYKPPASPARKAFPVRMRLFRNGHQFDEVVVEDADQLSYHVDMDSGFGRIDVANLYRRFSCRNCARLEESFRVCHSYLKWGAMQQEVQDITVRLERME